MSRVDDTWINSVVEKHAKLNELNEAQLDAVRDAVKDGITEGLDIGHYNGGMEAINRLSASHDRLIERLLAVRTFFGSLSSLFIFGLILQAFKVVNGTSIFFALFLTAIVNTIIFVGMDKVADYVRKRLNENAKNETGTSTETG